jgi:hypothetical protein
MKAIEMIATGPHKHDTSCIGATGGGAIFCTTLLRPIDNVAELSPVAMMTAASLLQSDPASRNADLIRRLKKTA